MTRKHLLFLLLIKHIIPPWLVDIKMPSSVIYFLWDYSVQRTISSFWVDYINWQWLYWNFSMWFNENITYFFIYCRNCGPNVLATYFLVPDVVYLWIWYRIWYFVVIGPNEKFLEKDLQVCTYLKNEHIILCPSLVQCVKFYIS